MGWWFQADRSMFRLAVAFALVSALFGVFAPRGAAAEEIRTLQPIVTEYGKVSLSIDGIGTITETGTVEINKPAGATVRGAYLASATRGYSGGQSGFQISDGDIEIDGVGVSWDEVIGSTILSWSYWADVTDLVSARLDGAAAGPVIFTISEASSSLIDGEILAVIWNDPNQTTDNTVALMFGAQEKPIDPFAISFKDPIDKSNPQQSITMSLGISFGNTSGGDQYSIVDVNGERLTTSAGGNDDADIGFDEGALLTVGGTGDSTENPPDPYALATDQRSDDELYDLGPFTNDGDRSMTVLAWDETKSDNIFFAAFEFTSIYARLGNSAPTVLAQASTTTVSEGQTATMTGTFADADDDAVTLSASIGTIVNNDDGTWSWSYPTTDGPDENQTVTITADDGFLPTGSATFDLVVLNANPVLSAVSGPAGLVEVGMAASFSATFSDPGSGDTHTAVWNWGDGTTAPGTIIGNTITGSHAFAGAGFYTVSLTITDDDGGAVTSTYSNIAVIDRDAGWLTIAGDFQSPRGAWTERPTVSASASIDVLAGYVGDSPTGRLTFTLGGSSRTAAAISFRATGFNWLVMGDDTAWLQGTGTLNGKRGYAFQLTATDGPGINANDGVRVRIWEVATNTAVYDNQAGQQPLSAATQPLKRGLVSVGGFTFR